MSEPLNRKRTAAGILLFAVLVILDQLTKTAAVHALKGKAPAILIKGVLEFYYLENTGAAFSLLRNAKWLFIIIAGAAIIAIGVLLLKMPINKKLQSLRIILIFISAGAAGNLIDRFFLGYVRDFIYFSLIDFPVFNVADIYVTCAVALLIILMLFYYKEEDFSFLQKSGKR